jgi:cyclic pyranopterin phosphate synthase
LQKTGGKSSFKTNIEGLSAHIIVCSDTISKGINEDKSGKKIAEKLEGFGLQTKIEIIPDEATEIIKIIKTAKTDLLIFTGGTGVGPRDITPDTITPLLDTRLAGVEEQIRSYGQQRMPYAMLSRSVAGIINNRIILALPGSTKGAIECIDAVFPHLLHVFQVLKGNRHD